MLAAPVSAQQATEAAPDEATSDQADGTPTVPAVDSPATVAVHPRGSPGALGAASTPLGLRGSAQRALARERTDQAELASINAESKAAKILYFFPLAVPPGVMVILSGLYVAHSPSGGFGLGGDDPDAGLAMMIAGGVVCLAGLVSFVTAIGLDVDSGSRRGAFEARRPRAELTSVSVAPTQGGALLQLGGRF